VAGDEDWSAPFIVTQQFLPCCQTGQADGYYRWLGVNRLAQLIFRAIKAQLGQGETQGLVCLPEDCPG
jgi:hypothetical protein